MSLAFLSTLIITVLLNGAYTLFTFRVMNVKKYDIVGFNSIILVFFYLAYSLFHYISFPPFWGVREFHLILPIGFLAVRLCFLCDSSRDLPA